MHKQYQGRINCWYLKCSWLYFVTRPLFGFTLSEYLCISCCLKFPRNIPNSRLVTLQTWKGHKKYVMTRFQIFSSFWIECRCQDTKACCHWCPVPGWGRCAAFTPPDTTGILETSDPKIVLRSAVKQILALECRDSTPVTSPSCWASVTNCLHVVKCFSHLITVP